MITLLVIINFNQRAFGLNCCKYFKEFGKKGIKITMCKYFYNFGVKV